jgi:hypothetical protein
LAIGWKSELSWGRTVRGRCRPERVRPDCHPESARPNCHPESARSNCHPEGARSNCHPESVCEGSRRLPPVRSGAVERANTVQPVAHPAAERGVGLSPPRPPLPAPCTPPAAAPALIGPSSPRRAVCLSTHPSLFRPACVVLAGRAVRCRRSPASPFAGRAHYAVALALMWKGWERRARRGLPRASRLRLRVLLHPEQGHDELARLYRQLEEGPVVAGVQVSDGDLK